MEEKNELSDIMLDKNNNKTSKIKKILLIVIVFIVLFLLILVGMKLLNKPVTKKNNFNIVLPPEPTAKTQTKQNTDTLFKQVPIIEENSSQKNNFNAMVEKLKKRELQKQTTTKQPIAKQPIINQESKKTVNNIKKALSKIKKHYVPRKKTTKKRYSKNNVYIQVGVTFVTKPSKNYLRKISKLGYKYTLYKIKISGKEATKILIGPYNSGKSAQKNISKIKKEINKAAFIYVIR